MNFKLINFLLLTTVLAIALSGCTNVESKNAEEINLNDSSKPSREEVFISNADLNDGNKDQQFSAVKEGSQLPKQTLPDNSEVETLLDGYGNKTETRTFPEHPRVRFLILRTSVDGKQEVTVYGYGSDTKIVDGIGDKALTATGDEIANAAQMTTTKSYSDTPGFMRRGKNSAQQQSLQPLPSSAFQKPSAPVIRQPESDENSGTQQSKPEED